LRGETALVSFIVFVTPFLLFTPLANKKKERTLQWQAAIDHRSSSSPTTTTITITTTTNITTTTTTVITPLVMDTLLTLGQLVSSVISTMTCFTDKAQRTHTLTQTDAGTVKNEGMDTCTTS
jgi:hypothetical protein